MKMRKTEIGNSRKGTFRFEHIESNLQSNIHFFHFLFQKLSKPEKNQKRLENIEMKNNLLQLLAQVTGIYKQTTFEHVSKLHHHRVRLKVDGLKG